MSQFASDEELFWERATALAERMLDDKDKGLLPSEWAERYRVLSNEQTGAPGHWDNDNTPYLVEIMNNFSPHSGCQEFVVMKATRMGFTTAIVNVLGWIITHQPSATRILMPNEDTLKQFMTKMFNPMIISSNLSKKITAKDNIKSNKKTGDSTFVKDFIGGHIIASSLNSKASLASYAAKDMIIDEMDEVRSGGDTTKDDIRTRARDRTKSFGKRKRIALMSMPSDKDTSEVYRLFLDGDQRYWFVPCPFCGHYQRIRWRDDAGNYCFYYDLDEDDQYIDGSAHFICENEDCAKAIYENHKYEMMRKGKWIATVKARDRSLRSYQISGLYSNLFGWDEIVYQWLLVGNDMERLKSFVKSVLGEPWEDRQASNLWRRLRSVNQGENVNEQLEFYWSPEQLANIKYITAGIDIQDGWIEGQIVGWAGASIGYDLHHFQITPEKEEGVNSLSLAFNELRRMISEDDWGSPYLGSGSHSHYLTKVIKGIKRPLIILIDHGYKADLVYNFCSYFHGKHKGVYTSRGADKLASGKVIEVKFSPQAGTDIIRMNTDLLKLEIDQAVRDSDFDKIAINIQRTRSEKYFKSLVSEHRVEKNGKYSWQKNAGQHRNEVLDCWVMARAGLWYLAGLRFKDKAVDWDKLFK